jgi:peptidoglycan hydrolase-like protein with peptidoglycan-binding domain
MKRTFIAIAVAVISFPAFAGEAEQAAAAQHAKVVTSVQATLGVEPIDGKMGPKTTAAIEEFQRSKQLDPSGKLDPKTLTALGMGGPKPDFGAGASTHMQGKPPAPLGPEQSSEVRTAEPRIKPAKPTGESK